MFRPLSICCLFALCVSVAAEPAGDTLLREYEQAWNAYDQAIRQGQFEKGLEHAGSGYRLGRELFGDNDPESATVTLRYGEALLSAGKAAESVVVLEEAVDAIARTGGDDSPRLIPALLSLAKAYGMDSEERHQRKAIRRADSIAVRAQGETAILYADFALRAGISIVTYSNHKSAQAYLVRARDIFLEGPPASRPYAGVAAHYLGMYYFRRRKLMDAAEQFQHASKLLESDNPQLARFRIKSLRELGCAKYISRDRNGLSELNELVNELEGKDQSGLSYPIERAAPVYPEAALRRRIVGYVDMEFVVDADGMPTNIEVLYECNRGYFGDAAVRALRRFRYEPLIKDGSPVPQVGRRSRISFDIVR